MTELCEGEVAFEIMRGVEKQLLSLEDYLALPCRVEAMERNKLCKRNFTPPPHVINTLKFTALPFRSVVVPLGR